jgi:hypothetical protein
LIGMRNNLTPTVVTDKNGKITTVHKKADAAAPRAKAIPAPQSPSAVKAPAQAAPLAETTRDKELSGRLYELMEKANGRPLGMNKFVFALRANNRQMKVFVDVLERDEGFWDIINAATASSLSDRDRPYEDELESIALIYDKDSLKAPAEYGKRKAAARHYRMSAYRDILQDARVEPAIKGITQRKQTIRLGEMPEETVNEVRAFVRLASAVREAFPETVRKYDNEPMGDLLEVALHSGHSTDDVIAVVREHHTRDAHTVLGILNGTTPAVANGFL